MRNQKGFTLIELVVVIGILAILAAFVFALLDPLTQFQKSDDGKRKFDLAQVQRALEQYYQDYGRYPQANGSYQILDSGGTPVPWGSTTTLWQRYMTVLPNDPLSPSRKYVYYVDTSGQKYWIYASLERGTKDPNVCTSGGSGICSSLTSNGISSTACGQKCNFGVSSPNVTP
ncbi:MAG TPA: type II secretion system protein [Patescibacteria group bacterium]